MELKDPLDYTSEELQALSTQELEALLVTSNSKESLFNTEQLALKIMMNSLYGALANKYFPLFNEEMAAAITGNGRYFIQKLANYIEDKLQTLHNSNKPYIIYGDTDSCVGSTLVRTDIGDIKIEDLFDRLKGNIEFRGKDNFILHVTNNIKAASVSKNRELQYNNINYVMKHKVKKRMYKIKCNGDEVTITEDHSMIVFRNNELIEIKPKDIQKEDKLIKII